MAKAKSSEAFTKPFLPAMNNAVEKICPLCKTRFTCGAESCADCWCQHLPSIMSVKAAADCYCPCCLQSRIKDKIKEYLISGSIDEDLLKNSRAGKRSSKPLEGLDYYFNQQGYRVFTAWYHLQRGYCCQNGCRHCPYGFKKDKQ